ncbi:G1 family glutamic endopeptidase [Alicyclobacillus acidiphilus]|uniref:G1 family glutamic endopeptidase n=1 Tax=Alicyclobacillus acidiphilus TaxID=182455 RepID=UPI00083193A3|nr:G1 family glutamic endopeptidase [Alicyclobacillus acidiphilus]
MRLRKRHIPFIGCLAAVGAIGVSSSWIWTSSAAEQQGTKAASVASNDPGRLYAGRFNTTAASDTSDSISIPSDTQGSANWGGYIATPSSQSNPYTSVTGSWVVPNVTGDDGSVAAQWIGLGGVTNQDLLQMGTTEQMTNGQEDAEIFWEKLPAAATNIMSVPVGSTISASISKGSGTNWNLVVNVTTPSGTTESKTVTVSLNSTYASAIGTSAEWISEDPSDGNNDLYPLADAGTVNFTNATVNGNPINASSNEVQPIALVDNFGNVIIAPSSLNSDGESFSTTTTTSTDTTIPSLGQGGGSWGQGWPGYPYRHGHHIFPGGSWGGFGQQSYGMPSGSGGSGGWQVEFIWG